MGISLTAPILKALALVTVVGLAGGVAIAAGRASYRFRLHPHPDMVVADIAEDRDGFLWLGAADGLYRFDGLNYRKLAGYPHPSARIVRTTPDGAVWVGSDEGLIQYRNGVFQAVLANSVRWILVAGETVIVNTRETGSMRVGPDLAVAKDDLQPLETSGALTSGQDGRWWYMDDHLLCSVASGSPGNSMKCEDVRQMFGVAVPFAPGGTWLATSTLAVLWQGGKTVRRLTRRPLPPGTPMYWTIWPGRDGQVWYIDDGVRGLNPEVEFRQPGESAAPATALLESKDRVWAAYARKGLVEYREDPTWTWWRAKEDLPSSPVQLFEDGARGVVAVCETGLYHFSTGRWTQSPINQVFSSGGADGDGGYLLPARQTGVIHLRDGRAKSIAEPLHNPDGYRDVVIDSRGRPWIGNKLGLVRFDGARGLIRQQLPGVTEEAVDLEIDAEGKLWAGYADGLAWLDKEDQWHQVETSEPVTYLRSFAVGPAEIWVARRRPGYFLRLIRNGDQWDVQAFFAKDGYGPEDTHFLKRDSRGWIWRGSSNGVHISDGVNTRPRNWLHLTEARGLGWSLAGQFGFLEDHEGYIWLSGPAGVTRVRPDPAWFQAPLDHPEVTAVDTGTGWNLTPMPEEFEAGTKHLRIDVRSPEASPFRDSPFQYRLKPGGDTWTDSAGGRLELDRLRRGNYEVQIRHAGRGDPPPSIYRFRIGPAPGPWWPFAAVPGGLLAAWLAVRRTNSYQWASYWIQKRLFLARSRIARRDELMFAADALDRTGDTVIGRYRLDRAVSRGGFSVVYDATDTAGGIRVAVKMLSPNNADLSWTRKRFACEVAALHSLNHEGIVPILDSWIGPDGQPGLAMPFLEGPTLRDALGGGSLAPVRAGSIVRQIGSALAAVHERGLVHRDLKPENVILERAGTAMEHAVVIDFGNVGGRGPEQELALTETLAGSFHYMAPEQLTLRYSAASDLYSLAAVVLEMLTGLHLADLACGPAEAGFRAALEDALRVAVGESAERVAAELVGAFHSDPGARPGDAGLWSAALAAELEALA